MTKPTGGTEVIAANPKNTNTAPNAFLPIKKEITSTAKMPRINPNFLTPSFSN